MKARSGKQGYHCLLCGRFEKSMHSLVAHMAEAHTHAEREAFNVNWMLAEHLMDD